MKSLFAVILIAAYSSGCSDDSDILSSDEMNYRRIAYENLSQEEKESITIDWKEADILKGVYRNNNGGNYIVTDSENNIPFFFLDKDIKIDENSLLVAVIFRTDNESLLGPLIVIVNPESRTKVGYVPRY